MVELVVGERRPELNRLGRVIRRKDHYALGDAVLAADRRLQRLVVGTEEPRLEALASVRFLSDVDVSEERDEEGAAVKNAGMERAAGEAMKAATGYVLQKELPCYRPGKAPLFRLEELQAWAAPFLDLVG